MAGDLDFTGLPDGDDDAVSNVVPLGATVPEGAIQFQFGVVKKDVPLDFSDLPDDAPEATLLTDFDDEAKTPVQHRRDMAVAKTLGVDPEIVRSDREKDLDRMAARIEQRLTTKDNPRVSDLLNGRLAPFVEDDIENMMQLEDLVSNRKGALIPTVTNIAAGGGERFFNLVGYMTRGVGTVSDQTADFLEEWLPLGVIEYDFTGEGPLVSWRPSTQEDLDKESPLLSFARDFENVDLGYTPSTTWEDFKKDPLSQFLPFALEQGLISVADMLAVMANLPAYVATRAAEIGQERADNNGKADATVGDFLAAAPFAGFSAGLERIGVKGFTGIGFGDALKRGVASEIPAAVSKATVKEMLTEGGQEFAENVGATLGTKKGFSLHAALDQVGAGMVGGAGFGGSMRTATATFEVVGQARREKQAEVAATDFKKRLTEILDVAGQSQLAAQEDLYQKVLERLTEATDVKTIRIAAAGLDATTTAAGSPDGAVKFFGSVGIDREAVKKAVRLGSDITVKLPDFLKAVKAHGEKETVLANVRESDTSPTLAEAVVMRADFEHRVKGEAAKIKADMEGTSELKVLEKEAGRIAKIFRDGAVLAGATPQNARNTAVLVESMYLTEAARRVKDPKATPFSEGDIEKLYASFGLTISKPTPGQGPVTQDTVTEFEKALDNVIEVVEKGGEVEMSNKDFLILINQINQIGDMLAKADPNDPFVQNNIDKMNAITEAMNSGNLEGIGQKLKELRDALGPREEVVGEEMMVSRRNPFFDRAQKQAGEAVEQAEALGIAEGVPSSGDLQITDQQAADATPVLSVSNITELGVEVKKLLPKGWLVRQSPTLDTAILILTPEGKAVGSLRIDQFSDVHSIVKKAVSEEPPATPVVQISTDQQQPDTQIKDLVPGETATFFLPDGSSIELEVSRVSEAGTIVVLNEKGEEEIVNNRLWTSSADSPSYRLETLEGTPEVGSLSDEYLAAAIERTEEKLEAHIAENSTSMLSILRELNAMKLERRRRTTPQQAELFQGVAAPGPLLQRSATQPAPAPPVDPLTQPGTWQDVLITVNNEDGTQGTMKAGRVNAILDRREKAGKDLLRCVGAG
jgi:hypothetical protein